MINLKISKRLQSIAYYIDSSDKYIYDVGCDHALLDIFLAKKYKKTKFDAIDISEKCIESAKITINKYGCSERINAYANNGLLNIKLVKNSTLVISGMGTHTIIEILNNCDVSKLKKIIIQSNNDLELLRRYIVDLGFIINRECSIYDKKFYVIIEFIPGSLKYTNTEYILGPKLIVDKKINKDYFEYLFKKNKSIYRNIPFFKLRKKIALFKYLNKIKRLLKK